MSVFDTALVLATYNSADGLAQTLEKNLVIPWKEIIIIDGFSTDNTMDYLQDVSSRFPNKIIVKQVPKKGLANARNVGTKISTAKYVMHAGPDNVIPLNSVENMIKKLDNYSLVSCQTRLADTKGYWNIAHDIYKKRFVVGERPVVGTPYVALRILFAENPFNETMLNSDDTEFCQRLQEKGDKIYRSADICYEYSFTTVADFFERWTRWGRGDGLFYNQMKSRWSIRRRIKSIMRPFFAEIVESWKIMQVSEFLYCLPFLLMVFSFRYYGWFRFAIISLFTMRKKTVVNGNNPQRS